MNSWGAGLRTLPPASKKRVNSMKSPLSPLCCCSFRSAQAVIEHEVEAPGVDEARPEDSQPVLEFLVPSAARQHVVDPREEAGGSHRHGGRSLGSGQGRPAGRAELRAISERAAPPGADQGPNPTLAFRRLACRRQG